jgi:hypothetical protein
MARLRGEKAKSQIQSISFADPGCLTQIPDPHFLPSRMSDLESNKNKKEEGKKCYPLFCCCHKYQKIVNFFIFDKVRVPTYK